MVTLHLFRFSLCEQFSQFIYLVRNQNSKIICLSLPMEGLHLHPYFASNLSFLNTNYMKECAYLYVSLASPLLELHFNNWVVQSLQRGILVYYLYLSIFILFIWIWLYLSLIVLIRGWACRRWLQHFLVFF
jgi:hypothetical protein